MRIIHLAAGAGDMHCGACVRDVVLARALIAQGHEYTLVPLYTPLRLEGDENIPVTGVFLGGINAFLQQHSALFRLTPPFVDRLLDNPRFLRWVSRFAVRTDPRGLGPMTLSVLQGADGRQRKELRKLVAQLRLMPPPDIISITNSLLSGLAGELRREFSVPVVCGLQGEDSFVESIAEPYRSRVIAQLRANVDAVDRFIAPSQAQAGAMQQLAGIPNEKVAIVSSAVEWSFYQHDGPREPGPLRVGHLSVIRPAKGLDLLIEAMRLLHTEGRHLQLQVAGKIIDEKYWRRQERAVQAAGLQDVFHYAGEVDRDTKRDFYRQCDIVALPTRIPEARGIAALEALAAGRPIVAPATGCFPEMIEKTGGGLLVPPDDAPALASAIARLADDADERERLGRSGAEGVRRHYSPEQAAQRLVELFTALISGNG